METLNKENYFNRHLSLNEISGILEFLRNQYGNLSNEDVFINTNKELFTVDFKNYFTICSKKDLCELFNEILLEGGLHYSFVEDYVISKVNYEDVTEELEEEYNFCKEYSDSYVYNYDDAIKRISKCFNYELFLKDLEKVTLNFYSRTYEEINGYYFKKFNYDTKDFLDNMFYFDLNGDVFYYGDYSYPIYVSNKIIQVKSFKEKCLNKVNPILI